VLEGPVAFADVWRVRLSAEAVEMLTLTGPFLAEPAKAWLLKGRGLTTAGAFAAVITEYLLYTVACSVLVLASLGLLLAHGALPAQMRPAAITVIAITVGFLMSFGFASVSGIGLLVPMLRASGLLIGRQRAARAAGELRPIEDVIVRFLHTVPIRLAQVLSIELAAQLLLVVEVWIVLRGLGFSPSLTDALIVEGGAKFVGIAFAFVPGQLGALEGVSALLAGAIGLPLAAGLSLALVRRVRGLLVAAAGVVALTGFRTRRSTSRETSVPPRWQSLPNRRSPGSPEGPDG
jgi:hypothetical protein